MSLENIFIHKANIFYVEEVELSKLGRLQLTWVNYF